MKWYVYHWNINTRSLEHYDVLNHWGFRKDIQELKAKNLDIKTFSDELRRAAQYHFWGRCEYEVIITSWPYRIVNGDLESGEKIDIYSQLMMNWESFVGYAYCAEEDDDE